MSVLDSAQRCLAAGAALGAAVALLVVGPAAAASLEYAVKANYLYKFAPFVEWPPRLFAQPSTPLTVCVLGEDPFGGALDEAVRGQTFNGRPIVVRRIAVIQPGPQCHVLFISRPTGQSVADALKVVADEPVLTVTDSRVGDAGIIHFVMDDGHVRFDINEAAAQASGLSISSKLLSLALSRRKSGA